VESLRSAFFLETKTLFTLTKKLQAQKQNDSAKDIANYWIINVSTHDISSGKKVRKVGIGTR
jgi:hypothetical protein